MNYLLVFLVILWLFGCCQANEKEDEMKQLEMVLQNKKLCNENTTISSTSAIEKTTTSTTNGGQVDKSVKKKCPRTFDGILCWEETLPSQTVFKPCPEWLIGFNNRKGKAKRDCLPDGTWTPHPKKPGLTFTDYMECRADETSETDKILTNHLAILKLIGKMGSILSIVSLIVAIIILSAFKRLHCSRNALHINLFASFLLFAILNLIKETFWVNVGFPKDLIKEHPSSNKYIMNPNVTHWECKTMMALFRYAESTNHATVFSEALYLNALLSVSTFNDNNHFKFYIAIGWVGPLIWIIPFIVAMATFHDYNSCWGERTQFTFFYTVPQVILIFLNFALFINTLRILKNKLRKNNLTDSNSSKRYSIYYIAFSVWQPFVVDKLPLVLDLMRLYFEIICGSLQGLAISSIYCFFNSEVQTEILTQIERKLIRHNPNMRRFSQAPSARDRISSVSTVKSQQQQRLKSQISEQSNGSYNGGGGGGGGRGSSSGGGGGGDSAVRRMSNLFLKPKPPKPPKPSKTNNNNTNNTNNNNNNNNNKRSDINNNNNDECEMNRKDEVAALVQPIIEDESDRTKKGVKFAHPNECLNLLPKNQDDN